MDVLFQFFNYITHMGMGGAINKFYRFFTTLFLIIRIYNSQANSQCAFSSLPDSEKWEIEFLSLSILVFNFNCLWWLN